tara:strand:- start:41 stop:409 length:369 start_codon:yes stop_codon:yes gene_type:complete
MVIKYIGGVSMEDLFSYGTLQQENVQKETFGRLLDGSQDILHKYRAGELEILDDEVIKTSGKRFHPILTFTSNEKDEVPVTVFKVTSSELLLADSYEVEDYVRKVVLMKSGIKCWAYVGKID